MAARRLLQAVAPRWPGLTSLTLPLPMDKTALFTPWRGASSGSSDKFSWRGNTAKLPAYARPKPPGFRPLEAPKRATPVPAAFLGNSIVEGAAVIPAPSAVPAATATTRSSPTDHRPRATPDRAHAIGRRSAGIEEKKAKRGVEGKEGASRWDPKRKISREAMNQLRALYAHDPATNTLSKLSDLFGISVEACRRILRSRFKPPPEVEARQEMRRKARHGETPCAPPPTPVQAVFGQPPTLEPPA